jgi:hypothetical protein
METAGVTLQGNFPCDVQGRIEFRARGSVHSSTPIPSLLGCVKIETTCKVRNGLRKACTKLEVLFLAICGIEIWGFLLKVWGSSLTGGKSPIPVGGGM